METTVKKKILNINSDVFLKAFRAYKQHKREWYSYMDEKLAKEEEAIRNKRETLYAEYE